MKVRLPVSEAEILAKRTPAGGWSLKQLAEWGIAWPPRRGWKKRLVKAGKMAAMAPKRPVAAPVDHRRLGAIASQLHREMNREYAERCQ